MLGLIGQSIQRLADEEPGFRGEVVTLAVEGSDRDLELQVPVGQEHGHAALATFGRSHQRFVLTFLKVGGLRLVPVGHVRLDGPGSRQDDVSEQTLRTDRTGRRVDR